MKHRQPENKTGLATATEARSRLQKRRELLLGAAKGSGVLLVAATPIRTLASQSICTHPDAKAPQIRCGISGMASGIGSRETYTTCEGYSPGWWGQIDNQTGKPKHWPSTCDYQEKYDVKFPKERLRLSAGPKPTLFEVMKGTGPDNFSNTDTFHWICAYLNALSGGPTGTFPYTGDEVLQFYNGTGRYSYDDALKFFKTYMETHTGS